MAPNEFGDDGLARLFVGTASAWDFALWYSKANIPLLWSSWNLNCGTITRSHLYCCLFELFGARTFAKQSCSANLKTSAHGTPLTVTFTMSSSPPKPVPSMNMAEPPKQGPCSYECLGAAEMFNRTIELMIEKYLTSKNTNIWIDNLSYFVQNYNSSFHSSIATIPERREMFDEAELFRKNIAHNN